MRDGRTRSSSSLRSCFSSCRCRSRSQRHGRPARPRRHSNREQQSVAQALSEALGHKSYVLLVLGFFTCGFQIFFIAVHLPAYLVDRSLPSEVGGWTLASIGLFNIVGAIAAGWLAAFMPKRYILSLIYFGRAAAILRSEERRVGNEWRTREQQ